MLPLSAALCAVANVSGVALYVWVHRRDCGCMGARNCMIVWVCQRCVFVYWGVPVDECMHSRDICMVLMGVAEALPVVVAADVSLAASNAVLVWQSYVLVMAILVFLLTMHDLTPLVPHACAHTRTHTRTCTHAPTALAVDECSSTSWRSRRLHCGQRVEMQVRLIISYQRACWALYAWVYCALSPRGAETIALGHAEGHYRWDWGIERGKACCESHFYIEICSSGCAN